MVEDKYSEVGDLQDTGHISEGCVSVGVESVESVESVLVIIVY